MGTRSGLVAACLVGAALVGCSSSGEDPERADDAAPGLTFEEGVELPGEFPIEDVPLVDGLVTYASATTDYHDWPMFQVQIDSQESFDDLVAEAVADLTGTGLQRGDEDDASEGYLETLLSSDELLVTLTITEGTDRRIGLVSVNYGVVVVPDPGLSTPESIVPFADGLVYMAEKGRPIVVRMLVDGTIEETVAAVEAELTAAGLPTDPDYPPTDIDGTTFFTASARVASVAVSVGTDQSTGRTDLAYQVWMN